MEALLQERPDLAGLPMAMGDTCRTKGDRTKFFTQALNTIKQARGQGNKTFTAISNTMRLPGIEPPKRMKEKDVIKKPSGDSAPKPPASSGEKQPSTGPQPTP